MGVFVIVSPPDTSVAFYTWFPEKNKNKCLEKFLKNSAVVCKIPTRAEKNFTDQINTSALYTNFPLGSLQATAEFFKNSGHKRLILFGKNGILQ